MVSNFILFMSPQKWVPALALACSVMAAQGTEVQVNVNADHVLCARFLKALKSDHIAEMSREQLCQYDFMQRHVGSYFQGLDWQPVAGNPVALTMKIFDANVQQVANPAGVARERANILAYATLQDRHHALSVEAAPFVMVQQTFSPPPPL